MAACGAMDLSPTHKAMLMQHNAAAPFGLVTFGLLFRKRPWETWKWFVPAAIVPLATDF